MLGGDVTHCRAMLTARRIRTTRHSSDFFSADENWIARLRFNSRGQIEPHHLSRDPVLSNLLKGLLAVKV